MRPFRNLAPKEASRSFFLDGGDSNFTKFLIDGVPMNQPGGAIEIENFDLEGVDKIEIVHGASSALFGSDAVSGVVQILSHRGTTTTPQLVLEGDGGTFETGRGSAQLSGIAGKFDYSATAGYFATSGQGPNDYMRDDSIAGNFGYKFSDTNLLRLTVRDSTFDGGVPGQELLLPPSLTNHDDLHTFTTGLTWDFQPSEHWHSRLIGWDTRIQQAFINSFGNSYNLFNRAGFDEQASYAVPHGGITAGYTYEVENGSEGGPHARRNNQAGYLEARYQFVRRVTVTAGVRAEANTSFGTRVVPRAGVAYTLRFGRDFWGATRLRASYGEGIKEPDFFDSFSQDPCDPGNPNLSPERSKTFDAGADQMLASDRVRVFGRLLSQRLLRHRELRVVSADARVPLWHRHIFQYGQGAGLRSADFVRSEAGALAARHWKLHLRRFAGASLAEFFRCHIGAGKSAREASAAFRYARGQRAFSPHELECGGLLRRAADR